MLNNISMKNVKHWTFTIIGIVFILLALFGKYTSPTYSETLSLNKEPYLFMLGAGVILLLIDMYLKKKYKQMKMQENSKKSPQNNNQKLKENKNKK